MFADIFQRQKNEVKECRSKTVNEVRASKFFAERWPRISSYTSAFWHSAFVATQLDLSTKFMDTNAGQNSTILKKTINLVITFLQTSLTPHLLFGVR